jgi:glycosyltransferase involved in cell wall biosynthesis
MHVLMVLLDDQDFATNGLPVAAALRERGVAVTVLAGRRAGAPDAVGGFAITPWSLRRGSVHPLRELAAVSEVGRLCRRLRPDLVHNFSYKPVLYGGSVAAWLGLPALNLLNGRGYVQLSDDLAARALRPFVRWTIARVSRNPKACAVFQNDDDRALFVGGRLVPAERAAIVRGAGIDIERFRPAPPPDGAPIVLFVGRLLKEKGAREFLEAAAILRDRRVPARFVLVGAPDPENPGTLREPEIDRWVSAGVVERWGIRSDMPDVLRQAAVVCLPSYGEGLPKVLTEAAACGRPIVTTDVSGCRSLVDGDDIGLLVPPRNAAALADALESLLRRPERRAEMGLRARRKAIDHFGAARVVGDTLDLYQRLAGPLPSPAP